MKSISGNIFTPDGTFLYGEISISGNIISDIKYEPYIDEKADYIIPGLVDIHSHGCNGYDVCMADTKGLEAILDYQKEHGITSYFPTTMTLTEEALFDICKNIDFVSQNDNALKGIYLEGPFISKDKAGSHNIDNITMPNQSMLDRLQKAANGLIKMVAIAPELPGAIELIEQGEYAFSIAHTAADYDIAKSAIDAGAKHVTHFYNAMTPATHREPGVVGAVMDSDDTTIELICDGIHVAPAMVRNAWKMFGKNRIVLISDSIEATGMPDGEYMLGDQKVCVKGKLATLSKNDNHDSSEKNSNITIAGSVTNLYDCMVNAVNMGIPMEAAIMAATVNPARVMGIDNTVGTLEKGKAADILVVSDKLDLKKVIQSETDI